MSEYQPSSSLGWIDFSDDDRQKVLKVIELLKGQGTVDELGIGVIRNSLSDTMFPGITTIMTRAKYYFIVPRILHDFITEKPSKIKAKEYLRRRENEIMNELAVKYDYSEDEKIMGISVAKQNRDLAPNKHEELQRKPSVIYWNALRGYKFYTGELSLSNLLDVLDRKSKPDSAYTYIPTEGETANDRDTEISDSCFLLPDHTTDWQKSLTIDLTPTEADYLKHRIMDEYPESLISNILKTKAATRDFLKSISFKDMCDMPFVNQLPEDNRSILYTAKAFWQIMEGAHIRFNVLLHKKIQGNKDYLEDLEGWWKEWVVDMHQFNWKSFDRTLMWMITKKHSKVKGHTEKFVNNWIDLIESNDFNTAKLDILVLKQEGDNKKSRSKLKPDHDEYYKEWVGISDMDFRFRNAKIIIKDIADKI